VRPWKDSNIRIYYFKKSQSCAYRTCNPNDNGDKLIAGIAAAFILHPTAQNKTLTVLYLSSASSHHIPLQITYLGIITGLVYKSSRVAGVTGFMRIMQIKLAGAGRKPYISKYVYPSG
jgi:hypothetical protein